MTAPLVNKEDVVGSTHEMPGEYYSMQMGAMLHDIGKFLQRTGKRHHSEYDIMTKDNFGNVGAHSKWSASFIRDVGLNIISENVALFHHKPSSLNEREKFLTNIVSKADIYSCKERIDLGYTTEDVRREPLINIFSNLKLSPNNNIREYYCPLEKLESTKSSFPLESKKGAIGGWSLQFKYEELSREFSIDTKKISNRRMVHVDTMYYLLKKYTSFMPSAAYRSYPDIALVDHLKTTCAISSCIYQYTKEKGTHSINDKTDYFIVISGDISGIQNYIYDISSPQFAQKGMAKRLRERSFYVNLLNDNLARIITDRLELNDSNILWCGGGHFFIIAANTDKTEKILGEYEKEVNKLLFEKYGGKLFLSLVYKHISGNGLDKFAELKEKLLFENSKKKKQKYLDSLDMVFQEEKYVPSDICKICGSISSGDMCDECVRHEDLGNKITRAEYLVRAVLNDSTANSFIENKFDFQEFGIGYLLLKKEELLENVSEISDLASKIQIFKLNDTNFLDEEIMKKLEEKNIRASFGFSFVGNATPIHEKMGPLTFEHIAKISKGSKKLGILRADIDNLTKLFETGLKEDVSISRISTMSSFLDIFVSGHINELVKRYYVLPDVCPECREKVDDIYLTFYDNNDVKVYREKEVGGKTEKVCGKCANKKIPMLYIGYSGGDDILIIGPWDMVIRFAKDLRDAFKKYTCDNKDINISAGIYMCNHRFPIGRAINIANDMLEKSKILDKDRISAFGETIKWESFDQFKGYNELLQFSDQLGYLVESQKISRGFVYSLITIWRDIFGDLFDSSLEDRVSAKIERKKYVPMIKYKLARVVKERDDREFLNKKLIIERMLPWIEIPASIAILKWRQ